VLQQTSLRKDPSRFRSVLKHAIVALGRLVLLISLVFPAPGWSAAGALRWNDDMLARIPRDLETFSFLVLGDTRGPGSKFSAVLAAMNEERDVLFALDVGDLVNYSRSPEDYEKEFFAPAKKASMPFLAAMGNHERAADPKGLLYRRLVGDPWYSFAVGDVVFLVLDNSNAHSLGREQERWLEERLFEARKARFRFVFLHVPLEDPRGGRFKHAMSDSAYARKLLEIFERGNVTFLFASHVHAYYAGRWGKIPFIVTGGGGAPLYGKDPAASFYHYLRVDVDTTAPEPEKALRITVRPVHP
jgi:hypothetical protein